MKVNIRNFAFFTLAFASTSSFATNYTFQEHTSTTQAGATVFAWNEPNNWVPSGVPTVGDTATISNATTCTILDNRIEQCDSLTIITPVNKQMTPHVVAA